MPPWGATFLAGLVPVLFNALLLAYYYGRLSQTVKNHAELHARLASEQSDQWSHINTLREDMGKIKGKLGLNGA